MESWRIVLILLCGLLPPVELSSPGESMNVEHLFCKIYFPELKKRWLNVLFSVSRWARKYPKFNEYKISLKNYCTLEKIFIKLFHRRSSFVMTTFKTVNITAENNSLDQKMSHLNFLIFLKMSTSFIKKLKIDQYCV